MNHKSNLLFIALFFIISSTLQASQWQPDTPEGTYRLTVFLNDVLPAGERTRKNVDKALEHDTARRDMITAHQNMGLYPEPDSDGQLPTLNKKGSYWGYHPALSVTVRNLLDKAGDSEIQLLEIGAGYGFDLISLMKKYEKLKATAIEMDPGHTCVLKELASKELGEKRCADLTTISTEFPHLKDDFLKPQQFDIVVISKVMHFYDLDQRKNFLASLHPFVNRGGTVIMTNISNHVLTLVDWATWLWGEALPTPESLISCAKCQGPVKWSHFLSPEGIAKPAEETGYKVKTNVYLGTLHEKSAAKYWLLGGVRLKEAVLFTVLNKVQDE